MYTKKITISLVTLSSVVGVSAASVCETPINIGYDINKVLGIALTNAKYNWEWGTNSETLLELVNPEVSVFSDSAFLAGLIPKVSTTSTAYAKRYINTTLNTLTVAGVSAGDPASLGISAILLGQSDSEIYSQAAARQVNQLLYNVSRYSNGAISHRYDGVMLWSDFIYMVPPTFAYQAVATKNTSLLHQAVIQISLYREALQDRTTGLWTHIIGSRRDNGTWSTGNGWVTGGICRVLATIKHWPTSAGWIIDTSELIQYAREIIDGAISVGPEATTGLLRNYITNPDSMPEASGTAMITASIYRLATLAPEVFATCQYLEWADARRQAVVKAVNSNGLLYPVVNPYNYTQNTPYPDGSPEGQDFAVMLYTAYRDCICSGICSA